MAVASGYIAVRSGGQVIVQTSPLRVTWHLGPAHAADAHELRGTFTCTIQPLDAAADRSMFEETFLAGRDTATPQDLVNHFTAALQDAFARAVRGLPAEHWLEEAPRAQVSDALRAAAQRVAFGCGVRLLAPIQLATFSPTLQQQRSESLQRQAAELRVSAQIEHMQRAAELLRQFRAAQEAAPELSAGQILARISPADQGAVLQTLLAAEAGGMAPPLWAVAGGQLLRIDAAGKVQAFDLPRELGPLRSVTPAEVNGRRWLLVGARGGVSIVDAEDPGQAQAYQDEGGGGRWQLGFNSAAVCGGALWASHGEAGVVGWEIGRGDAPVRVLRPGDVGGEPRNLTVLDDSCIVFSRGVRLMAMAPDGPPREVDDAGAPIVALLSDPPRLIVVREDGEMCFHEGPQLAVVSRRRHPGRIAAAALLPWLGSHRIVLATAEGGLWCVGMDDPVVTQYLGPYRGLRAVAGCTQRIAAVSPDRQRLVFWDVWEWRQPSADMHLASITRHRIADVAFG